MSIPNSLKLVNASEVSSAVVSRKNVTIYPTGSQDVPSNVSGGSIIEFKIPVSANESVDMSTFFMHFNFQITNRAENNYSYVNDSIESIFDEVTVYLGSTSNEIERIRLYNRLESAMNNYISSNFVKTVGSSMFACGLSRDQRRKLYGGNVPATAASSGNTVQMSVPLRLCGSASPSFIMPSQIFGQSSFLIIRVRLANPASCCISVTQSAIAINANAITGGVYTAGSCQYNLSNVRASFDMIQTSQDYQNQMSQFLASSNLVYPVKTWDVDARVIPSDVRTFTENLSYNYKDIEAIFFWFNRDQDLTSFEYAGEDRLRVPDNIKSLQLVINGSRFPSIPIDLENGASEALTHTITALGSLHHGETMGPFNYDRINSTGVVANARQFVNIYYNQESGNRFYGRERSFKEEFDVVGLTTTSPTVLPQIDIQNSGVLNPYLHDLSPSQFLIGINLRKLLDLPEGELSGLNLQNTSGSIGYEIKFTGNHDPYSMGVAVLHNRFINLSGAGVNVDF